MSTKRISAILAALCISTSLAGPIASRAYAEPISVTVAGTMAIKYGPSLVAFMRDVSDLIDNTNALTLELTQHNANLLAQISTSISRIEPQLAQMQSQIEKISADLDNLHQDRLYFDIYSLQTSITTFYTYYDQLHAAELVDSQKATLISNIDRLESETIRLLAQSVPILRNADQLSENTPISIHTLSSAIRSVISLSKEIHSTEIVRAKLAAMTPNLETLIQQVSSLLSDDGLINRTLNVASQQYISALNERIESSQEFRAFAQLNPVICVETRHVSPSRQFPEDEYLPPDYYAHINRETGEQTPTKYSTGYRHFAVSNIHAKHSYMQLGNYRILGGISDIAVVASARSHHSLSNCDVKLEDRNAADWLAVHRDQFNTLLNQIEPYAIAMAAAYSDKIVLSNALNALSDTLVYLQNGR